VLLGQRFFQIAIVRKLHRIVCTADERRLFLELPHNSGFGFGINGSWRRGWCGLQGEVLGAGSIHLQQVEKLATAKLQEGEGLFHADFMCKIALNDLFHFLGRIPCAEMSSPVAPPDVMVDRENRDDNIVHF